MGNRKDIINSARAWFGAIAGDAKHREILDTYNNHRPLARGYKIKPTDAWCATFVSACAIKSGNADVVPLEVSCPQMVALAQQRGIWKESDDYRPDVGDIILYDWEDNGNGDNTGTPDHVGIVSSVIGNTLEIIEGNMSNKVGYRRLSINGRYIRGYITPKYTENSNESEKPPTPSPTPSKTSEAESIEALARECIAGLHGNADARKNSLYEKVQDEVNNLLKGKPKHNSATGLASAVISGRYGNGDARKENIYRVVQDEVNELLC